MNRRPFSLAVVLVLTGGCVRAPVAANGVRYPPPIPSEAPKAIVSKATYVGVAYDFSTASSNDFKRMTAALGAAASPYAVAAPGGGNLGMAYVFRATASIDLWRAYTESDWNGRWWALDQPQGSQDAFRADYVICPEWNGLRFLVHCRLKPGAVFAAGPGNSASCKDGSSYPGSSKWQVYLPLTKERSRLQVFDVEAPVEEYLDCSEHWRVGQDFDDLEAIQAQH
jgi:hypothetical protein